MKGKIAPKIGKIMFPGAANFYRIMKGVIIRYPSVFCPSTFTVSSRREVQRILSTFPWGKREDEDPSDQKQVLLTAHQTLRKQEEFEVIVVNARNEISGRNSNGAFVVILIKKHQFDKGYFPG